MSDPLTTRFAALVSGAGDDLPLDEACLLIAAHAIDGLDEPAELTRLDQLAAGVREPTAAGVVRHLCDELGFAGDRVTYHDARNSLLPEVLDRRLGIPISLAIVAIEVGRRCGADLVGVGMPGHFLVQPADEPHRFLDVFAGGTELDAAGCREVFGELHPRSTWDDTFLEPVSAPRIIARVLANLAGAYRRAGERQDLAWALDLRMRLPGTTMRERRELAALLGALGRFAEGATVLEALPEERDQRAAARFRARLN